MDEAAGYPSGPASGTKSAGEEKEGNFKTVTERKLRALSEKVKKRPRRNIMRLHSQA